MPGLSLATFNAHAGVDGWGRPYDLTDACRRLDADVVVLQESFAPLGVPSQADDVAAALDYTSVELPLARAWRRKEPIWHGTGWQPRRLLPTHMRALRVGGRADATRSELAAYEEGTWGLAVLSRARILTTEALELGRLKRDFTHRSALAVRLCVGSPHSGGLPPVSLSPASLSPASLSEAGPPGASRPAAREEVEADFTVVGMHAAHLSHGSPIQLRRLASQLPPTYTPAAIAGDLNLWGPPVSIMLPGWTRAVRGRTWPAWRPHSQPDHILVSRPVKVSAPEVIRTGNSDHRAVRAVLYW